MKIFVIRKKLGSRKELGREPLMLVPPPQTLRELLSELTLRGLVEAQSAPVDTPMTEADMAAQAVEGSIRFGERYGENRDTAPHALQVMLQAFTDGLFRVFVDGEENTSLDTSLTLREGSEVVFVRLTMLTGLMWLW